MSFLGSPLSPIADTIVWEIRGGIFFTGRLDYPLYERRVMTRCIIGGYRIEPYRTVA